MPAALDAAPANPVASTFVARDEVTADRPAADAARTLAVAGLAHAVHDGYTDMIYALLPVWQAEFALGYAALALLRGLYAGAMAALQVPAARLATRLGGRTLLVLGTALAALGYALAGLSGGVVGLGAALAFSGAGSSVQHPVASSAVSRAYGPRARGPLGTYNFAGDLGKAALPALVSLLLAFAPWRAALWAVALLGLAAAAAIALLMPPVRDPTSSTKAPSGGATGGGRGGFPLLFTIGMLDTGVRMGVLTFLPFLLRAKGASPSAIGAALALVFVGGAAGKFACGRLGERIGVTRTVLLTEGATAASIAAVLVLPLVPALVLLPLLGMLLNGTSSVLYGTVPELARPDRIERAFALFYTGVIGAGAVAPVLYGLLGDAVGPDWATVATAATALAITPLALLLAPRLPPGSR